MKTTHKLLLLALAFAGTCHAAQPVETLTEPQKETMRDSLGLGTAATADTSTTGGVGKVLMTDSNGNLKLAPLRALADTGSPVVNGGNLILTDRQMVGWHASDSADGNSPTGDGKLLFRIRQDNSHPYETNFDASGSICFYWGDSTSYRAFQLGSAAGGAHYIYRHSGYADGTTTMRQSVPDGYNTMTWTGGASVLNRLAIQATPLDLTGTNSAFQFFRNTSLGGAQAVNGTLFAEIAPAGVWSAGTAPAFDTLTDGATITHTASKYKTVQTAKVTLEGSRTLAISGAEAGMRGVIIVKQDGTGSRLLTLPSGSSTPTGWALSTTPFKVDRLSWEFDGTYYYWSMTSKGMDTPVDSDVSSYITTTGATDTTGLNEFVLGLKSMGLWTTSKFWPLRSTQNYGSGTAVKSLGGLGTFDGTISGSAAWGTDGITFDGVDDRISISNPAQSTSLAALTLFSVHDSDGTTSRHVFGSFGSSSTGVGPTMWVGGSVLGGSAAANSFYNVSLDGTNTNATSSQLSSGNTGNAQTQAMIYTPSANTVYANTASVSATPTRASIWNNAATWEMGARNNGGAYGYYYVGVQSFHFVSTTALSDAQHTALRDLYKATLGAGLGLP
jgi:hypothetical protein